MSLSRAFRGRGGPTNRRLPPGQYDTSRSWPVLTAEVTPRIDLASWTFTVEGLVERPTTWTWDEMHDLPSATYSGSVHCVTSWSKFDLTFTGVAVETLLNAASPLASASHVLVFCHTAYTTNLPLADVTAGRALVTWEVDGAPLPREHGGPARLVVPHLYFWKSAKWVAGLRVLAHDEPGFWEVRGYHNYGNPWREQRYQGD